MKHAGNSVMAWAYMAASRTGTIMIMDDVTHDGSCKMNAEVYILSAHVCKNASKLIRRNFYNAEDTIKNTLP